MDYEKKYDELMAKIEAVKKDPKIGLKDGDYYNGYVQKGIRSALDYLLQEESEDERISKAISAAICGTTAETVLEANGVKLAEALTYLKKQKEQKPNVELIQKSWYLEGYHDGKYNNEPKWLIQTGEGGPRYEENPKYGTQKPALRLVGDGLISDPNAHFELESEQKPAEWSEEDENALEYLDELIGFGYSEKFMDAQTAADLREWVNKSLRHSWKPSYEQMEWLESAVRLSTDKPHIHGIIISLYEQLKRL